MKRIPFCLLLLPLACGPLRAAPPASLDYSFGSSPRPGFQAVAPDVRYTPERGYGFDLGSQVTAVEQAGTGFVTGRDGRPFFFSTRLAPGAYRVTVTLGDPAAPATTTVKTETRRLMLQAVRTEAGQAARFTFLVHVRVPQLPDGRVVRMKTREKAPILYVQWDDRTRVPFLELDWDEKLTFEFSDRHPALQAIEIAPADHPVTIYLVGDSTMTDQMMEPWAAWGQMFPRWFTPPVLIANYAECGETVVGFAEELRWPKLLSEVHPGDYILMQFGINDQRLPLETFRQTFLRFIADARARGAIPVLVTSQNQKRLGPDGKAVMTLRGYPEAMRAVARQERVPLIDLNAMSLTLYTALGPAGLAKFFVDGTHQSDYGAYELAKCVVQGAVDARLPWTRYLTKDWQPFDPAHPDPIADFHLPADPQLDPARPGGPGAPDGRGPMAGELNRRRPAAPPPPAAPPAP
jgi:lysophospholipase L1-like esterase